MTVRSTRVIREEKHLVPQKKKLITSINKTNRFETKNFNDENKNKNHEKIKKDSIGITKINEKIKKDSIRITKTNEKIKKHSFGITKTHKKIIKSKKYVKKSKKKSKSMTIISRNKIQKNQKTIKITRKNNIKIQKNQKNTISAKNQKHFKRKKSIGKKGKVLKSTFLEPNINMTQPEITNIDHTVLTIEGVLEDIMSQTDPHLWEKQLLEIVNQYDDKNNRARICAYRRAIVILQNRLEKRDEPHMIRVIIKKTLRSYKKRLEKALDTLTSTPPSSDDEDADYETANCFNLLPDRPPTDYEVLRKVDETHSVETTKQIEKVDQNTFVKDNASYNNIKNRKIIINNQKNNKRIKKLANKKLNRSTPKKDKTKQPSKIRFSKRKTDVPLLKWSKTTKILQQKQFDKNISLIKKKEKEECMTLIDISNIDCTVQSWRYPLCVTCAVNCNATYLHDLYLASANCQKKSHIVSKRTSILKGYGKFKAAVEFINATRKLHTEEIYEARYYSQNAIRTSNLYDDNLNLCVKKLAMNILEKLSTGEYNDKSLAYFTLTELIILSNKNEKKMCPNAKFKNENNNQSLYTFDKKNASKFENALVQKVPNLEILNPVKNQPMAKKIFHKKNNLLLGGSRERRKTRVN